MYSLNASYYSSVFAVPSVLVDKYIKMASYCAIKALLWILKTQGGNFSVAEIAKAIGSSEGDTKEALDYWVNEGVLTENGKAPVSPVVSDSELKKKVPERTEKISPANTDKKTESEIKLSKPTMEQIAVRMEENSSIKGLFNQAQEMLGKTIGYNMQASLLMMYDDYGFGFDVILTLLQYCVQKGTTSTAFISGLAKSWYKQEIFSLEAAHEYIDSHNELDRIYLQFKQFTGITLPKPSTKIANYLSKGNEMGFSIEMMVLAYNEAGDKTGKISPEYAAKILLSWHEKGYKTPEDVKKGAEDYKAGKQESSQSERSYDINKAIEKAQNGELVFKKKSKGRQAQ